MAKVTGPLMSMSATGTVGKAITFGAWKGIEYVREWFRPSNPNTALQIVVRARMSAAVAAYKVEDQPTKDFWNLKAVGQALSGSNLYTRAYIAFMKANAEAEPTVTDTDPMTAA